MVPQSSGFRALKQVEKLLSYISVGKEPPYLPFAPRVPLPPRVTDTVFREAIVLTTGSGPR